MQGQLETKVDLKVEKLPEVALRHSGPESNGPSPGLVRLWRNSNAQINARTGSPLSRPVSARLEQVHQVSNYTASCTISSVASGPCIGINALSPDPPSQNEDK